MAKKERTIEEQKKLVSARLEKAFDRKKKREGRWFTQKQMAVKLGLRSDSMFSDLINGYSLPSAKTLAQLAADPDIGTGIYDDMGLPRPMPEERIVEEIVDILTNPDIPDKDKAMLSS